VEWISVSGENKSINFRFAWQIGLVCVWAISFMLLVEFLIGNILALILLGVSMWLALDIGSFKWSWNDD
jgi:hypothetical protein